MHLAATKDELIDLAMRSGAPLEVIENLQEMEDEGEIYECIEDIWPTTPAKKTFSSTRRSINYIGQVKKRSLIETVFLYLKARIHQKKKRHYDTKEFIMGRTGKFRGRSVTLSHCPVYPHTRFRRFFSVGYIHRQLGRLFSFGSFIRAFESLPYFSEEIRLLLMVGFCGGFTTFSSFIQENVLLLQTGQYTTIALYTLTSLIGGTALFFLGVLFVKSFS